MFTTLGLKFSLSLFFSISIFFLEKDTATATASNAFLVSSDSSNIWALTEDRLFSSGTESCGVARFASLATFFSEDLIVSLLFSSFLDMVLVFTGIFSSNDVVLGLSSFVSVSELTSVAAPVDKISEVLEDIGVEDFKLLEVFATAEVVGEANAFATSVLRFDGVLHVAVIALALVLLESDSGSLSLDDLEEALRVP